MKRLFALLAAAALLCAAAAADTYQRDPAVDVVHYLFKIELTGESDAIKGEASIDVDFLKGGKRSLALDLVSRRPDTDKGMTVSAVTMSGVPAPFEQKGDRLLITLEGPPAPGEERFFTVSYSGRPADGLIIAKNRFGRRTFFGDNWPERARNWLPTVDHPHDKATCEFAVTAPAGYQVVSNGSLVEETDLPAGKRLTRWRESRPIAVYCMVIGAAPFAVRYRSAATGVQIQDWVFPEDRDAGFRDYFVASRVVDFFSSRIGPFPYEKLANVQSLTRYGGTENSSAVFYNQRSVTGKGRSDDLVAHEIAHQWFGDAVTEDDWNHIWLSEGFATYFTHVFNEFTYGRDRMAAGLKKDREQVIAYHRRHPRSPVVDPSITSPGALLTTNSYEKGSWVLHMLRREVGDEAFWKGIRAYYDSFRDKTAVTEDFRRVMEKASGRDLRRFFRQWLFEPGEPVFKGIWSFEESALTVELDQAQPDGFLFDVPLDIGVALPGGGPLRIETVRVKEKENRFTFPLDAEPVEVVLDPDTWLLMETASFGKKGASPERSR